MPTAISSCSALMYKRMKKRKQRFRSLYFRYSMAFLSVLILAFTLLLSISGVMVGRYYKELRHDELTHIAITARELIKDAYQTFEKKNSEGSIWKDGQAVLDEALSILTVRFASVIFVTDMDGKIIYIDREYSDIVDTQVAEDYRPDHALNDNIRGISSLGVFEKDYYFDAVDITAPEDDVYIATVYVCLSTGYVSDQIEYVIRWIVYISVGVMLFALLISYLVTRHITQPLAQMSEAARAFAEGDFSVRVHITGHDEMSEFARVFNEMAESLDNIEQTRNDFVANVSHDLRSPMTSINGFIDGMLTGVIPPEKHEHYLRVVLTETKRLSRLVTTLLDISRIQAGERKFKMVNFDICEMGRQILFSFENRIDERDLQIAFDLEKEHIFVSADMDAIYQVLYNLCDNAVKFSREGGCVKFSVHEKGSAVTVSVYNEGEGIPDEDIRFVFDRFYKADKSRGIHKTGTGLGLYISKKIIEAHKQTITLQSEYQKYCRFTFTLNKGDGTMRRFHKLIG